MPLTLRVEKGSELSFMEMDDNFRYMLGQFEAKTDSFTATHGKFYLVTPAENTTVIVTLPSTGKVGVRLTDASSGRKVAIYPGVSGAIESFAAGDRLVLDVTGQRVILVHDGTVWRVV